jgi:tRNA pseudouridine55 synthase
MILHRENIGSLDTFDGFALLINKPLSWTSFDVVNKLRYTFKRYYNVKKIKVGHAGTLDPLATGLLIICVGKMTKRIDEFQAMEKIYSGTLQFGSETFSADLETEVSQEFPFEHIDEKLIEEKLLNFHGEIDQVPPIYSALKQDGIPLYKLARAGKKVEVKPRKVCIDDFKLIDYQSPLMQFYVRCSKGTYIRSLAVDLGRALNSGAHLTALRRESIGEYDLKAAWALDEIVSAIESTKGLDRTLKE